MIELENNEKGKKKINLVSSHFDMKTQKKYSLLA